MRRMLRTILCTALSAALLLGGGTQANAALTDVYYEKEGQVDYGDVYWPILVDGFYCVLNPLTGKATIEGAKCSGTVLKFPEKISYDGQSYTVTEVKELFTKENPRNIYQEELDRELYENKDQIQTMIVPGTVSNFGMDLYTWDGLKRVRLQGRVGRGNFTQTHTNAKITLDSGNKKYKVVKYGVYSKSGKTLAATFGKKTSFTVKKGTTKIGDYAFRYYKSLKKLTLPATVKYIGKGTFEGVKKSCKIYVPDKNVKRLVLRSGFKGKVVVK